MTDYGVPMIDTLINGRWRLLLPEHRAARPEWKTGWERERLDSMHEHLADLVDRAVRRTYITGREQRPVIIDVGVEEGDLTALYSSWGCDVVMVEPNPRVWPNIRAIWKANGLRMPLSGWVGFAGDHDTPLDSDMCRSWLDEHCRTDVGDAYDGWPSCAHGPVVGDHAFLHAAQHPHVPTVKLDTLILDGSYLGGHITVDAITIDVEGSELSVLRGAAYILARDRPLVWVSVHTDEQWMDENYPLDGRDAVVGFMSSLGYRAELLAVDHEEHWLFEWGDGK